MKGCRNCTNWLGIDEHLDRIDPATSGQKVQIGQCRRYAPKPKAPAGANGASNGDAAWPRTASDDWCGEWDPRLD
jgi:hypothetical protein